MGVYKIYFQNEDNINQAHFPPCISRGPTRVSVAQAERSREQRCTVVRDMGFAVSPMAVWPWGCYFTSPNLSFLVSGVI